MTALAVPHPIPATFLSSLLRVTADQYHAMINGGAIPNSAAYELLDGFIVHKDRSRLGGDPMGHDPLHVLAVTRLIRLAARLDDGSRHMLIQLPIALTPLYEPEPDAAIIRGAPDDYRNRLASPADVLSVIEVAHSSLERDRTSKLAAYGAAGIPQYIIVNLQSNTLEVHTQPDKASGTYRTKTTAIPGQSIALQLQNDQQLAVPVSDILP